MSRSYYRRKLSASRLAGVYALAGPRVRQYLQAEIDHVAGFVNPGDCILELGCGYGRVLAPLAAIAGRAWGMDNSLESLRLLRQQSARGLVAAMDAGNLGFKPGSFDLVVGIQNFISACKVEPQQLMENCLQVTRPGGLILLSSYTERFWPHRLAWFKAQAEAGLLGPIDEAATADGVIVCKDGFRATTFSPQAFHDLALSCGVSARVVEVDNSSLFCEITKGDVI